VGFFAARPRVRAALDFFFADVFFFAIEQLTKYRWGFRLAGSRN
jgi:hypothetical protein